MATFTTAHRFLFLWSSDIDGFILGSRVKPVHQHPIQTSYSTDIELDLAVAHGVLDASGLLPASDDPTNQEYTPTSGSERLA